MVFDIEKKAEDKMKFLEALLDGENGIFVPKTKVSMGQMFVSKVLELANYAKLSDETACRLFKELEQEGMLKYMGGGGKGSLCCLTKDGRDTIERHLYDKSLLAKRRKLIKFAKEGGVTLSKRAFAGLCSMIAGLGLIAAFKEQIIHWFKVQLNLH